MKLSLFSSLCQVRTSQQPARQRQSKCET